MQTKHKLNHSLFIFGLMILLFGAAFQLVRAQTPDSFNPNPDAPVITIAAQPDGKVLVGGYFTHIGGANRDFIARLNEDGSLDTTFNPPIFDDFGAVSIIVVQPDGKILVGGYFNTVGNAAYNYIVRLNEDGSLDTNFNPMIDPFDYGNVNTIVIQTNGKILIGGDFASIGGVTRNNIARLNMDGTLDTAFNPNADSSVLAIVLQPDGKIVVGGTFSHIGGATRNIGGGAARNSIARLNANGTIDTAFNPTPNSSNIFENSIIQGGKSIQANALNMEITSQPGGTFKTKRASVFSNNKMKTACENEMIKFE